MLASTADDVEAALDRLHEAAFEYKVDGARIQLHKAATRCACSLGICRT
jgi:ATP-dependent DNA ligase